MREDKRIRCRLEESRLRCTRLGLATGHSLGRRSGECIQEVVVLATDYCLLPQELSLTTLLSLLLPRRDLVLYYLAIVTRPHFVLVHKEFFPSGKAPLL